MMGGSHWPRIIYTHARAKGIPYLIERSELGGALVEVRDARARHGVVIARVDLRARERPRIAQIAKENNRC